MEITFAKITHILHHVFAFGVCDWKFHPIIHSCNAFDFGNAAKNIVSLVIFVDFIKSIGNFLTYRNIASGNTWLLEQKLAEAF
jgi:hypothetical protein